MVLFYSARPFGKPGHIDSHVGIYLLVSFWHQVHFPHLVHFNNLLVGVCINNEGQISVCRSVHTRFQILRMNRNANIIVGLFPTQKNNCLHMACVESATLFTVSHFYICISLSKTILLLSFHLLHHPTQYNVHCISVPLLM